MKPIIQALLLADHVYQDINTRKMIIAGTFNSLRIIECKPKHDEGTAERDANKIPVAEVQQAGSPYVYFSVTDIRGETDFELQFINLRSQEVIFRTSPITVKAKDPLTAIEVVLPVPKLPTKEGVYVLEILWQNELLGSHRVVVQKIQKPE